MRVSKAEDIPDDGNLHIDIAVDITNLLTPAATLLTYLAYRPAVVTPSGKASVIEDLQAFVEGLDEDHQG